METVARAAEREMVFDRKLGKLRPLGSGHVPCLTSSGLGWAGYRLEHHCLPSLESHDVVWLNNVVFVQLNGATSVEIKRDGKYLPQQLLPGQITLVPAHAVTSIRARDPLAFLALALEPGFMTTACCGSTDSAAVELPLRFGFEDSFIEGACLALRREVAEEASSGRVYADSLASSIAVHLVHRYGTQLAGDRSLVFNEAAPQVVRDAIDYINARLGGDLSLQEIAAAIQLSPFHFARLFKRTLGISPHQFVLQRRIERAKQLLIASDLPVATIAIETGFYDQSHLTHHFKRQCRVTPAQFRRNLSGKISK